ncbi:MAG: SIMPL domain-containing protein [Parcubacteria group bacterium]
MKSLFRAAAVSALILASSATAASAQTATASDAAFRATTLNLSAYGETHTAPDKATISLGVQTQGATAVEAIRLNAEKMTRVIAALKKGGIAAKDIQTSGLSLNPQYAYPENLPPRLTGYQASNMVTVTVHDLSRVGQAVDATVNAGADTVGGVSFGLEDSTAAENEARLKAVSALQAKADLYAKAMGYRVARLVTMNEGSSYAAPPPAPPVPMAAMARAEAYKTPVEPGEMNVRTDVSATYELTR